MTRQELRQALAALPADATLTLRVAELREALADGASEHDAHPPALDGEKFLTAVEVAERLHVTRRWVYEHSGQLNGRRLSSRCVRFPETAVSRYVARRR